MLEWYKVGEIMKIMKYGLITFFILSFILFALPFVLKGILNIGNITGMLVSFLCVLVVLNSKQLYPYLTSKITIIFVIVFLGIITFCSYKILSNINHPSNKETTVVVLGCRVKDKKPSLALKERLDKTYEYLNENKELNCILSGGQGDNEEISEAKCMYQYLVKKGIDKKRLYLEDQSTSTRENILFSYKIIEKENFNKAITIITNEFHEYRAQTIASHLNIESYAISAKTAWWLFPTYFVREIFGMIYEFIF